MKNFKVVLIANDNHPIPSWVSSKLQEAGVDYIYHECYHRQDLYEYAVDADMLWLMSSRTGLVVEENMDLFKKVGAVLKCGSGTDNIDHNACTKRGIIVAHTPEDPTEPTSDHFIAMLFTAVRQIARQDRLVRSGVWSPGAAMPLGPLQGADLGLVGFGRIGRTIVRKLSGFEMNIRVFDPHVDTQSIKAANCEKVELEFLLKESRYIMVACPLTTETCGMLGAKELAMMRKDAILVNVARAGIVDEEALIDVLRQGHIKAAAIDVLQNHPLKPTDEWLSLENAIFTPHMGGYPYDYPDSIFSSCVDIIIELSQRHLPRWIANKGVIPKWNLG